MPDIPQNPTFSALTQSAYSLGRSLPKPRIDVNAMRQRVKNITSAIRPEQLGTTTTNYGGTTKFEQYHGGIDLANTEGTPIPAFTRGTVTEAQAGQQPGGTGFGNYVIITDENNNKWRYSHLRNNFVRVGEQVASGNVIGTMGHTGSVYSEHGGLGTHLDLRIKDAYGKYIDPNSFFR